MTFFYPRRFRVHDRHSTGYRQASKTRLRKTPDTFRVEDCPKRSHFTPNVCLFLDSHRKTKKLKNLIPTPRSLLLIIIVIVIVIVIVSVIAPDSGHICEDD